VYHKSQQNLQRIREFQPSFLYTTLQEDVVKNCIALFSTELLLRLLPENAPAEDLFAFSYDYFTHLDKSSTQQVANFPVFFVIQCGRLMGYEVRGGYSMETPHANLHEGMFTTSPPPFSPFLNDEDAQILSTLLGVNDIAGAKQMEINGAVRVRLLEWYIEFLQRHAQHVGHIKSLGILQSVLH
jgi:DNA repair protein RecO (recombination protein O)